MTKTAIKFENISKQYRLGVVGTGTISHDLNRWWHAIRGKEDPYLQVGTTNDRSIKATSDYVWALRDINFDVKQGDVVGIIGKNGAGKSTLLKLLSRVTSPTTGSIKARGRIASLLEVGTGFHPELTGRENIYMNGAIMGMTKAEITHKLDEIVDFAGVEMYIDTPTKRYSSGMTVRLGFAIAAHLEPEILVVDEVLAVGDAEFQKKAIGKMQDVSIGEGRTVLFVSHNLNSVATLCRSGIVLENGEVAYNGTSKDAIDFYTYKRDIVKSKTIEILSEGKRAYFTGLNVTSLGHDDKIYTDSPTVFTIDIEATEDIKNVSVGIPINDFHDNRIFTLYNRAFNNVVSLKKGHNRIECFIESMLLKPGEYRMELSLTQLNEPIDYYNNPLLLEVLLPNDIKYTLPSPTQGSVVIHQKWIQK